MTITKTHGVDTASYSYLKVPGTNIILHIDVAVEKRRALEFMPLLRSHGESFVHRKYDGSYPVVDPINRCFDAAMDMALKDPTLTYVEGLLVLLTESGVATIGHGWCVRQDGVVVDPTSSKHTGNPTFRYLGVRIKTEYSVAWKKRAGYFGCLDGYPDGRMGDIYLDAPAAWHRPS